MNRLIYSDQSSGTVASTGRRMPLTGAWVLGSMHGTRLAIGWSLPVVILAALAGGWLLRTQPGNADLPILAAILAGALLCGSVLQGGVRWVAVHLLGAKAVEVTLHAFGAWGETRSIVAGRRIMLGLTAPVVSLGAAVSLASMPPGGAAWRSLSLVPPELVGQLNTLALLSVCVWVLMVQGVAQLVPLPRCHGRECLIGIVEALGSGMTAPARLRLLRRLLGGIAVVLLGGALALLATETPGQGVPRWPFLLTLSAAIWTTRRVHTSETPPASLTLPATISPLVIQPLPAAAGQTPAEPRSRRRASQRWFVRYWGSWRVRAAQRRERSEAVDAERLDAILDRLHRDGIGSLGSEERAVLHRVSERLRKMQRGSA